MMNSSPFPKRLPKHPAFLRLSETDRRLLLRSAEIWSCPAGSVVFHPGDSGEDLILLLEGQFEEAENPGEGRRWLAGDMWGEERLLQPFPVERALKALQPSIWLRWPRSVLLSMAASSRSLEKSLAPVRDEKGQVVSGLLEGLPSAGGALASGRRKRSGRIRHLHSSLRQAWTGVVLSAAASAVLYFVNAAAEGGGAAAFLPLLPAALFCGWFLVFLVQRILTEYIIEPDAVRLRSFTWSRFAVESRRVPSDRIQGVAVERNGIIRRLLNYGTVRVKTAALDGELVLKDVDAPEKLASEIRSLSQAASRRSAGRDQEAIRRSLERSGAVSGGPRLLRPAEPLHSADSRGKKNVLRFRKSGAILFGRLLLPLLCTLLPLAAACWLRGWFQNWMLLILLVPLFWIWYRFEDWRNDSFRVEGAYAVDVYRKPLGLKESRRQVDLLSVQNIRTEQKGVLSFLFRFGDVILVTAGGASDAVFASVARPWQVQEALFRAREEALSRREESRRQERQDELVRFAAALGQLKKED